MSSEMQRADGRLPAHARLVRRSALILPVNVPGFVERAHLRGADAIVLDLEDSVPKEEKGNARRAIPEALRIAEGAACRSWFESTTSFRTSSGTWTRVCGRNSTRWFSPRSKLPIR